jgi:hypothetical protein
MGWPKGKARKVQQAPVQPQKEAKFNETVGSGAMGGDDTDFSPDERMNVYQEFAKQNYPDALTELPPDNGEGKTTETTETDKTEKVEEKPEVKAEEKVSEEPKKEETVTATEKVEPVQATEKKPEEIKTVPYGALHEERMKRKDLQRERDDMKSKVDQLMQDNVKLMSKGKETSEDQFEPVYKNELDALRQEIVRLNAENTTIKQRFQTEDARKREDEIFRMIERVDQEETAAGRPGFKQYGWNIVATEINKIAQEDPDLADTYRNPDGWKLLHAKKFPEIRSVYVAQDKKDVLEQKKQAKTEAGLVTTAGKAPVKEASEPKTQKEQWDEYLKMRTKLNL